MRNNLQKSFFYFPISLLARMTVPAQFVPQVVLEVAKIRMRATCFDLVWSKIAERLAVPSVFLYAQTLKKTSGEETDDRRFRQKV